MKLSHLKNLIENQGFTKGDFEEINKLFFKDANENCELITFYMKYCEVRNNKFGPLFDNRIHEISYSYIANIENRLHHLEQYLFFFYNREAEYFTFLNSCNDALYYAEKLLDLKEIPHVFYAAAVIYILNALANSGAFDQVVAYEGRIKELTSDENISELYRNLLEVALLDCYAFGGQLEEYKKSYENVTNIYSKCPDEDVAKKAAKVHLLSTPFLFKEILKTKTNDELVSNYKQVFPLIKELHGVLDCYSPFFIPMFEVIRKIIPEKQIVTDVIDLLDSVTLARIDACAFGEYLIKELGVTYKEYPRFFHRYFNFLRNYNKLRDNADKQSISITLLEHDLQNKYKSALNVDQLTGVYSRYAFHNDMTKFVPEANSIAFVADLNFLKFFNDNYGHSMGDRAIILAAERLEKCFGAYGKIYRFGGDEFFIYAQMTDKELEKAFKKFNNLSQEPFVDNLCVEVSIGYAFYKDYLSEDVNYLFKAADRDMYTKKTAYYQQSGHDRRKQ